MKARFSLMALFVLMALSAQAADKKAGDKQAIPEPTKEQRQKMATLHEKMAACLKTDKPVRDCHKEMMDSCQEMGKDCPMLKGYFHGGRMGGPMGGPRGRHELMHEHTHEQDHQEDKK